MLKILFAPDSCQSVRFLRTARRKKLNFFNMIFFTYHHIDIIKMLGDYYIILILYYRRIFFLFIRNDSNRPTTDA